MDRDLVRRVARLARLDIAEAEEEQFVTQLGSILDYFEQLGELDTEDVPPTTRAVEVSNITREDNLAVFGDRDTLLARAPDPDGDFFRVPQILNPDEG